MSMTISRAGDIVRINFHNLGTHHHSIHFHGIHPANMDGVFEVVGPGESFVYEFEAKPFGVHLYHCHVNRNLSYCDRVRAPVYQLYADGAGREDDPIERQLLNRRDATPNKIYETTLHHHC